MLELDGHTYQVQTAEECAYNLVNYVNEYCRINNVKNFAGEPVSIAINLGNPLYLLIYGVGYLISILQKLLWNAACAFNLISSSDTQLLDIAELCNIRRRPATNTTIRAYISAAQTGPCSITPALAATIEFGGRSLVFRPVTSTLISAGSADIMVLRCTAEGSYAISAQAVTNFDENPDNFGLMRTDASQAGQPRESIAAMRLRIQNRFTASSRLVQIEEAIGSLTGVLNCVVYFNYSSQISIPIDTYQLPPRTMLLLINGYNELIAQTLLAYTTVGTLRTADSMHQSVTLKSGQVLDVYFMQPRARYCMAAINVKTTLSVAQLQLIRATITLFVQTRTSLNLLTAADLTGELLRAFPTLVIMHCELSGNGSLWQSYVKVNPFEIIRLNAEDIQISEYMES